MFIKTLKDNRIYEAEKIGENRYLTTTGKEISTLYSAETIEELIFPGDMVCVKIKIDDYDYLTAILSGLDSANTYVRVHKNLSQNDSCGKIYSYEYYLLREIKGRKNLSFKAVAFSKDGEKFKLL